MAEAVRAGVVGLGMMGGGIAATLDRAGLLAGVHDARREVLDDRPELVGRWADTPAALAEVADVVFVVVIDMPQVEQVVLGPGGIAEAGRDVVACVCSTVEAADVQALAALAAERGVTLVDVGIAGGPDAAATGGLLTTTGADDATFERILPCLDAMSVTAIHGGPVGTGMQLKLVKNALSFMMMATVHEALLFAEEMGFGPELVKQVAADSNLLRDFFWFPMSRPSARRLPADTDPAVLAPSRHFAALAAKDVRAAAAEADRVGVDHPVMDLTVELASRYFLLPDE
jgi:3-hydroxyisobutyrate dehydrogenase-like beta-hydroxyacid dehydrogenase